MSTKLKYPTVLLLTGFILLFAALMLRFLQWPGGQFIAWGAIILQVISIKWLMAIFFKSRYADMLFLAAFILLLAGLAFKIMHWPYAQAIIVTMILIMIIAVTWLIVVMLKKMNV
jgi:hypothetical protein